MSLPSMASVLPLIESGRVRALAVTSLKRASSLPQIPTLDESGLNGYDYSAWYGINAPAAVPRPLLPDVQEAFVRQGMESQSGTPQQFVALIAREIEQTVKLLQIAGIKAE